MSLFCITQSEECAGIVKNDFDDNFPQQSRIYRLRENLFLTATPGFRQQVVHKAVGNDHIFIFGTIINESGFTDEIVNQIDDYDRFMNAVKEKTQNFYGHYIIVGFHEQKQSLEIVTDRTGCLNVYYTCNESGQIYIGNDLYEVSRISHNTDLDIQAVGEFLMTESNVNERTFFRNIVRLGLGNGLLFENDRLAERTVYEYRIEQLSMEEYMKRIDTYFGYVNRYGEGIEVDISGGYDTRLIASVSHQNLSSFKGFSAGNRFDGGIDVELSPVIADLLGIECHNLDYADISKIEDQREMIWHATSCLRDSNRSKRLPILFSHRYKAGSLSLGGYGGEVMRAKYNRFPDLKQFISYYYKGYEAEKICGINHYQQNVRKELEAYPKPQMLSENMIQNWYYAMAKMRIWGSAFLQMGTLYGDIIHPFMDWYLMGPVFGFPLEELKDGKLQKQIIQSYAPELKDIPYNRHLNAADNPVKHDRMEKLLASNWEIRHIFQYIRMKFCYAGEAKELKMKLRDQEFPAVEGLDINRVLLRSGASTSSRMMHILNVKKQLDGMR